MLSRLAEIQYIISMKCDNCAGEDSVFYIFPGNDGTEERLCHNCASIKGYINDTCYKTEKSFAGSMDQVHSCPKCAWTQELLRSTGRIGCDECSLVFRSGIEAVKRQLDFINSYEGKSPSYNYNKNGTKHDNTGYDKLNTALENAIKNEDFESAAIYRDELLKKKRKG